MSDSAISQGIALPGRMGYGAGLRDDARHLKSLSFWKLSGLLANFDTAGEFPLSNFCHQCSEFRASCRCQVGATEPFGHPDQVHRCRSRDVLQVGLGLTDIT